MVRAYRYVTRILSFYLKSIQVAITAFVLNLLIQVKVPYSTAEKKYDIPFYFGSTTVLCGIPDYNSLIQWVSIILAKSI